MVSVDHHGNESLQSSVTDEATQIISDGNFHQCLWVPATTSHDQLRVTFSTTTNFANTSLPVLLFCGPMFSSRWAVLDLNHVAVQKGVRVICVDRPGMGGSSRVPLNLRVQVWLETVPLLLKKLNIEHVGLLCHSTGVMFALNTLYCLRDILDPTTPYLACMAPWVNDNNPHTALMKAASKIPDGLFDYWHGVIKFAQQRVVPVASWSGGVFSSILESKNPNSSTFTEKYGRSEEVGKEIERLKMLYLFQEDISGADEDARLCLRKEGYGNWGVCEDYHKFVQNLTRMEQERTTLSPDTARLKVHTYFASSDIMIGQGGQEYFVKCWRQAGVDENVQFETCTLDDTTHDSLLGDLQNGALSRIFDNYAKQTV